MRHTSRAPRISGGVLAATLTITLATGPLLGAAAAPTRNGDPGRVTIKRDTYGIPHVYANTTFDLFRGYGYAVAQDRLFQMEMSKRSTQGLVSEVLGPNYVAFDKDTRAGSNPASIKEQISQLPAQDRAVLDGYAAGMNAYLAKVRADKAHLMPKQFIDFGFEPSDWTAYDVAMVWVGTMANRYSDSSAEVSNYQVLQALIADKGEQRGRALFDQLVWQEDPRAITTVPRGETAKRSAHSAVKSLKPITVGLNDLGARTMQRNGGEAWPNEAPVASNFWSVGKAKAAGANSILVNGPQFQWFNPSYVYGIGLHGAGFDVSGSTPFAYPSVIFGTNGDISWGATAGPLNLVDIYQETLNPANPRQYLFKGAYRDMDVRTTTIKVKGGADVTQEILSTVHGAVTSVDQAHGTAYSKKRSWSGHEVASLMAWVNMTKAHNFKQVRSQAAHFATTINWYYADAKGNIGYISPGFIPARPASQDMRLPAKGDGSMEWTGIAPFFGNPQVLNPRQGYIMNWNNQSGPGQNNDYGNWGAVDRANEIDAALQSKTRLTPQQMWNLIQRFSFADLNIRYLRPALRAAAAELPATDPRRADLERLIRWNGQTRDRDENGLYDGPEPTIMRAWLPILFERVLADDLPAPIYKSYVADIYPATPLETRGSIRPAAAMKLVYNGILGDQAGVKQTVDFFNGKRPADVVASTLAEAMATLRSSRGADLSTWTTPVSTMAYSSKNFLGIPAAGADETIQGPQYMNRGTANHMAVLGGGANRLCLVGSPGQSGFVAPDGTKSPHYADQLELFRRFGCRDDHLTPSQGGGTAGAPKESTTTLD